MAASSCSPSLTPLTARWITTSSEGSPPPGRWSIHICSHQHNESPFCGGADPLWSPRCPPSTRTQSSTSAGRTSSRSTSITQRSLTRRSVRSWGATWVSAVVLLQTPTSHQPAPPQSATVTVIRAGSPQTLWPPSLIKLLIMSSAIAAKCCGGSLCAPLIAWDIERLRWYTHVRIHTPGFT